MWIINCAYFRRNLYCEYIKILKCRTKCKKGELNQWLAVFTIDQKWSWYKIKWIEKMKIIQILESIYLSKTIKQFNSSYLEYLVNW